MSISCVPAAIAAIIKIAMIDIHRVMQQKKMTARLILQVHDELVFEVPPQETDELKTLVGDMMPRALKLIVPLKIDIKQGKNWGEME